MNGCAPRRDPSGAHYFVAVDALSMLLLRRSSSPTLHAREGRLPAVG